MRSGFTVRLCALGIVAVEQIKHVQYSKLTTYILCKGCKTFVIICLKKGTSGCRRFRTTEIKASINFYVD